MIKRFAHSEMGKLVALAGVLTSVWLAAVAASQI